MVLLDGSEVGLPPQIEVRIPPITDENCLIINLGYGRK